jgi:hypothetical protein
MYSSQTQVLADSNIMRRLGEPKATKCEIGVANM